MKNLVITCVILQLVIDLMCIVGLFSSWLSVALTAELVVVFIVAILNWGE